MKMSTVPRKLVVAGAGSSEVNGTYTLMGSKCQGKHQWKNTSGIEIYWVMKKANKQKSAVNIGLYLIIEASERRRRRIIKILSIPTFLQWVHGNRT